MITVWAGLYRVVDRVRLPAPGLRAGCPLRPQHRAATLVLDASAWLVLVGQPVRSGPIPAITRIWRVEMQFVAAIDATILAAGDLKPDLLAVVVQLELRRIERDAARAEVGAVDAVHPGLADPERLALGGGVRGRAARRSFRMWTGAGAAQGNPPLNASTRESRCQGGI